MVVEIVTKSNTREFEVSGATEQTDFGLDERRELIDQRGFAGVGDFHRLHHPFPHIPHQVHHQGFFGFKVVVYRSL